MALTQVKTAGLADDAVTSAKIADDTVAEANMANDAIGLAEIKAGTDGQILTFDASGNPAFVGPGTDGQVLTSTGAGSPPAFEAASGGISDVVSDTSPQLGGNLDTNSFEISLDDNHKVNFGDSNDLQVYHNTNAYMVNSTGDFYAIVADGEEFYVCGADTHTMIKAKDGEGVELYYNNVKKVETTSTGFLFDGTGGDTYWLDNSDSNGLKWRYTDNVKGCYGTGDDLQIYHDGSNSYIKEAGTGDLLITTDGGAIQLQKGDTEVLANFGIDGSSSLFYDNLKTLETIANGIKLIAGEDGQATLELWADEGDDNPDKWRWTVLNHAGGCNLQSYEDGAWENRLAVGCEDNGAVTCCFVTANDISDGGISFGNANIGTKFYAVSDTTNSIQMFYNGNGVVGTIKTVGSATQFNTSSDYRLKENEVPLENAITKLKGLKPYTFNFKNKPSEKVDGFYAHEAAEVVPVAVTGTKDEMAPTYYKQGDTIPSDKKVGDWTGQYSDTEINPQGVDYGKFTPLLTKALQEAIAKIETLETKVAALEAG